MKILATFVNFNHDTESVELAHAWDEYCVDSNFEGFTSSRAEALASYGDDIKDVVHAEIEVPMFDIYARFDAAQVKASGVTLSPEEA